MELEEMKTLWGEMTIEIEKQKKLTDKLIIKMIRMNYKSKINKILIPEILGSFVALGMVVYILISFPKLDSWQLQTAGVLSSLIFVLLPVLSIRSVRAIKSVNISAGNYKDTLAAYSKARKRFVLIQKLSFYLVGILLALSLPVTVRIMGGKDMFVEVRLWLWYAAILPFVYIFSKWVFKKYIKMTADAENILKELES